MQLVYSLTFKKSFDFIDHNLLLNKLNSYGIKGICYNFFSSYISKRFQYTITNNIKSSLLSINQGVLQGLILGPLIFSLYINDLSTLFYPGHIVLNADNSTVFFCDKDLASIVCVINSKLTDLGKWLCFHRLHLSVQEKGLFVLLT